MEAIYAINESQKMEKAQPESEITISDEAWTGE